MANRPEKPLARAVRLAGGSAELARKLTSCGHDVRRGSTVYQWLKTRVPAEYCPDIEALTGVSCEELRGDVKWGLVRDRRAGRRQPAST